MREHCAADQQCGAQSQAGPESRLVSTSRARFRPRNDSLTFFRSRSDATVFAFLEEYLEKLEGPLAVQVWPRYLAMAKEVASSPKEFRLQVFPVLRSVPT